MKHHLGQRSDQRAGSVLFLGTLAIFCVGVFIFLKPFFKDAPASSPDSFSGQAEQSSESHDEKGLPFISVQDIWTALGQGKDLRFLDIRTREAFDRSHVPYSEYVSEEKLSTYTTKKPGPYIVVFSLDQGGVLQKVHEILKRQEVLHFFVSEGIAGLEKEHYPLISFGDPDSFIDRSKVTYLTAAETKKYLSETKTTPPVFLDVRSAREFSFAHVKGALNIPLEMIEEKSVSLDRSTMFLVYGNTMLDAFQAAVRLSDLNFALIRAVSDTPPDIEKAGIPIEKGTGS